MDKILQAVLVISCATVGAALGFRMFNLAARDERTLLPNTWRPAMAAITGILCGLITWHFGFSLELPAMLALPLFGVLLAAIDLRTKLLPNALVFPFLIVTAALLIPAAMFGNNWAALFGAVIGGASLFVLYLVLALLSPGLGMGDVKLAGILGLYGGYAGPAAWVTTALGGFILGAGWGVFLLVFAHTSRKTTFPFGPAMLAATLAAMAGWT